MSSIRLFVLGSLAERGPMHGHALRLLAVEEHIDMWADVAASAIYAAMKRLDADGLIRGVRTEREGNYPERQVYDLTEHGLAALDRIRRESLDHIVMRPDPVDLALARLDEASIAEVRATVEHRVAGLQERLDYEQAHTAEIARHLTAMEKQIMRHPIHRIRGEIAWHQELLEALPELIADEKSRKGLTP